MGTIIIILVAVAVLAGAGGVYLFLTGRNGEKNQNGEPDTDTSDGLSKQESKAAKRAEAKRWHEERKATIEASRAAKRDAEQNANSADEAKHDSENLVEKQPESQTVQDSVSASTPVAEPSLEADGPGAMAVYSPDAVAWKPTPLANKGGAHSRRRGHVKSNTTQPSTVTSPDLPPEAKILPAPTVETTPTMDEPEVAATPDNVPTEESPHTTPEKSTHRFWGRKKTSHNPPAQQEPEMSIEPEIAAETFLDEPAHTDTWDVLRGGSQTPPSPAEIPLGVAATHPTAGKVANTAAETHTKPSEQRPVDNAEDDIKARIDSAKAGREQLRREEQQAKAQAKAAREAARKERAAEKTAEKHRKAQAKLLEVQARKDHVAKKPDQRSQRLAAKLAEEEKKLQEQAAKTQAEKDQAAALSVDATKAARGSTPSKSNTSSWGAAAGQHGLSRARLKAAAEAAAADARNRGGAEKKEETVETGDSLNPFTALLGRTVPEKPAETAKVETNIIEEEESLDMDMTAPNHLNINVGPDHTRYGLPEGLPPQYDETMVMNH